MVTDKLFRVLAPAPNLQQLAGRVFTHFPARQREVAHFGQRLLVNPAEMSGYYLYYVRAYDAEVFALLDKRIADYQRVLDVGANIGVYTVYFAPRVPVVEAFEPIPAVALWLKQNIALNGFTNATVHEACVSDKEGEVTLALPSKANSGIGRISTSGNCITRPTLTLDKVLNGCVETPTLIKMDIEGAEWLALQGASQILHRRHAPLDLLMEIHPDEIAEYGGSTTKLAALLRDAEFSISALNPAGLSSLEENPGARFWFVESRR